MQNTTAQFASAGDELTRSDEEGNEYDFRVRHGGNRDPADNVLVYLNDPNDRPVDADVFWTLESNEAAVIWYDAGDGLEAFDNESHIA